MIDARMLSRATPWQFATAAGDIDVLHDVPGAAPFEKPAGARPRGSARGSAHPVRRARRFDQHEAGGRQAGRSRGRGCPDRAGRAEPIEPACGAASPAGPAANVGSRGCDYPSRGRYPAERHACDALPDCPSPAGHLPVRPDLRDQPRRALRAAGVLPKKERRRFRLLRIRVARPSCPQAPALRDRRRSSVVADAAGWRKEARRKLHRPRARGRSRVAVAHKACSRGATRSRRARICAETADHVRSALLGDPEDVTTIERRG